MRQHHLFNGDPSGRGPSQENRLLVMLEWAWAYLAVQRRVRLITVTNAPAIPVSKKGQDEGMPKNDKIPQDTPLQM